MAKDTTSNRDAAAAAKVLKDPRASKKDKTLAASALVQWPVTKPRRTSRDKIIEAVLARKREKERAL